jgi:hypothetical protein
MISTGIQRSLRLSLALAFAGGAMFIAACNGESDENGDGAQQTAQGDPQTSTDGNGSDNTPQVDSEALATVLAFQEAVLELEFETARTMVDETSAAHENMTTAVELLENLSRPEIPDEARDLTIPRLTEVWRGATVELVLEEGNSAIVSVTRSNGESSDVNLNLFEGVWLINSPDDLIRLQ